MKQKMVTTERDCKARLVPAGNPTVIPEGEFVNITQELGGNYTVTWRGNMYRIDGTDAGAKSKSNSEIVAAASLPIRTALRILLSDTCDT